MNQARQDQARQDQARQDHGRGTEPADRGSGRPGRGGPLRAVLAALEAGAADPGEVAARTGLDRGVVSAAVAHLVRSGHLRTEQLAPGCPAAGCASCGSHAAGTEDDDAGTEDDDVGCHGSGSRARGPVLITLARRPASS